MAYHVNEDKPTNKATVHTVGCSHTPKQVKKPQNGKWHGPFNTKGEALETARNTDRRDVEEAGCGLPPLHPSVHLFPVLSSP